jgi:hypothetical protein
MNLKISFSKQEIVLRTKDSIIYRKMSNSAIETMIKEIKIVVYNLESRIVNILKFKKYNIFLLKTFALVYIFFL